MQLAPRWVVVPLSHVTDYILVKVCRWASVWGAACQPGITSGGWSYERNWVDGEAGGAKKHFCSAASDKFDC